MYTGVSGSQEKSTLFECFIIQKMTRNTDISCKGCNEYYIDNILYAYVNLDDVTLGKIRNYSLSRFLIGNTLMM